MKGTKHGIQITFTPAVTSYKMRVSAFEKSEADYMT